MKRILFTLIFIASTIIPSFATIINVPADQPTIQAGINAALTGDTVLVAIGTYYENINFNGKNIVVGSWFLTTGDTSYISQTVIDGDSSGTVVTFENGEDSTAILSGFTLTNGTGKFISYGSQPMIDSDNSRSIVTVENSEDSKTVSSQFTLTNGTRKLDGEYYGGSIYCNASHPIIEYCKITQNSAMNGGGIYCINANPSLMNLMIISNSAYPHASMVAGVGGGILLDNSNSKLVNVTVNGNTAIHSGGGISCNGSNPILMNVMIYENTVEYMGGGIYFDHSNMSMEKVTIIENTAGYGGGIYCYASNIRLGNVTIVNNTANSYGGGIYCSWNSTQILVNTILWNNLFHEVYFDPGGSPDSLYITYSDVQDSLLRIATNNNGMVSWLDGNITKTPLFVGGTPFNCNLTENSPCIDAGTDFFVFENDTLVNMDSTDYHGFAPDMGAIESPYFSSIQENIALTFKFTLHQNYPNPFNPTTTIEFDLPKSSEVTLKVFNILGEEVTTLVSDRLSSGTYSYEWDAGNFASGVYLYRLQAGDYVETRKMVLMR